MRKSLQYLVYQDGQYFGQLTRYDDGYMVMEGNFNFTDTVMKKLAEEMEKAAGSAPRTHIFVNNESFIVDTRTKTPVDE